MHALVLYESMYGNTHAIATAIGDGIGPHAEVRVMPAGEATDDLLAWADLVVAGGPTHSRRMSTAASRQSAVADAATPDGWSRISVDPAATGPGIREWLDGIESAGGKAAAAFDTRVPGPALITGRASKDIARAMRGHGFKLVADPESFQVDTHQELKTGETDRARAWGAGLAALSGTAG